MNFISILFLVHTFSIQEPKVKKIEDINQIEILNSIDNFKQYHTNSFKVNLFRVSTTDSSQSQRFPTVKYIIGVLNYSDSKSSGLFEAGSFYNPEIVEGVRLKNILRITLEHGEYSNRTSSTLMISRDGVTIE
ncbi:MAG: hypothetical protein RIM99_02025 [Cyclobacteriaceae bacterium]